MTLHTQIGHVTSLARIEEDKYVRLDKFTVRSLDVYKRQDRRTDDRQDYLPQ